MSTRSHIGYRNEDNSISAVYCHFDGYPSKMIPALSGYIDAYGVEAFKKRIKEAQVGSGFQSFDGKGGTTYFEHRQESGGNWTETDRASLDNDYAYIFSGKSGLLVEYYNYGKIEFGVSVGEEGSLDVQIDVERFMASKAGHDG